MIGVYKSDINGMVKKKNIKVNRNLLLAVALPFLTSNSKTRTGPIVI